MPPPLQSEQEQHAASQWATQHMWKLLAQYVIIIAILCTMVLTPTEPKLYHTSILSGQMWVDELLDGHPDHICCELGLQKGTLHELFCALHCFGVTDLKYVGLEEQLALLLYMLVTGLTIWHTGKCFQCLNDTISKCFQKMLGIFLSASFYTTYVTLPNANASSSQIILCNQKLWTFFQHALGAIDGTHIVCTPPAKECGMNWNWKGSLSQNYLFVCPFNLTFIFGYTGWEGSAIDSQMWEAALDCGFDIPDGHYYLADVGYPEDPWLLLLYCGVRYHLAEWNWASQKYIEDSVPGK